MRPAPPSDTGVRIEVLTSSVVDADVPSNAVMQMVTSVLRSPLFSATELMDFGIDLTRIFWIAATSYERGRITATSAKIREDTVEELSSTSTLFKEMTWQAAAARMKSLPARPAIDRERIVSRVCMVDNRSGIFCLMSFTGQLRHDHAHDSSQFGVRAVVTLAKSYDVIVGGVVLYSMGFRMDYWTKTTAYLW
ncbi:hypothetical protein AXG93_4620s1030 [Marchantia polymorpha subsp. ruderalis]|uniref:Uncharacterized protein n=1 Tax=Marchantia polymorpha subsp. ruderalis TaxID=1480154 RepID=A0A176VWW1_MARPO|nr:hypothetical protein AXG93_4620s1030 [Marchantia polymorpha subsp. ruderalis]